MYSCGLGKAPPMREERCIILEARVKTTRCSPFVGTGQLVDPVHRVLSHKAHVLLGTGGRLVGEMGGKQRRPIIFDHHNVVLRHVHCRREPEVT
ncbi:hypothetical protein EYF80_014568 [Liparis tanakae]|uniref:Uncharacterized protein n=1 Tax=Liparis tanakae TaxID=230148 RepID=A0A4Z2IAX7_9TELE|nr:hypothetical protein EYF80_014568 [Liparis tanakae]